MPKEYQPFIPQNDAELGDWMGNFKEKIATIGTQVNLPAVTITKCQDDAQTIKDGLERATVKKQEQQEAIAYKKVLRQTLVKEVVSVAILIKRSPLYTENMGRELGIIGVQSAVERKPLRPTLRVTAELGYVLISFNKQRQSGITIYSRLRGSEGWETLISGTNVSPYIDRRPLQTPGIAETREYTARYWDNSTEIGQESDIVVTLFGG